MAFRFMRRFAFSYYVGVLILVFFLYAGFLRAVLNGVSPGQFCFGITVGALAMTAILVAIGMAWKGHA